MGFRIASYNVVDNAENGMFKLEDILEVGVLRKKIPQDTNGIMNHHCCHNCCYRHGMLKLQDVLDIQEVAGLNFRRKKVPQVLDLVTAGLQAKS